MLTLSDIIHHCDNYPEQLITCTYVNEKTKKCANKIYIYKLHVCLTYHSWPYQSHELDIAAEGQHVLIALWVILGEQHGRLDGVETIASGSGASSWAGLLRRRRLEFGIYIDLGGGGVGGRGGGVTGCAGGHGVRLAGVSSSRGGAERGGVGVVMH